MHSSSSPVSNSTEHANNGDTTDDFPLGGKRIYFCSKCGQPKKGHLCQQTSEASKETSDKTYSSKKRPRSMKKSPKSDSRLQTLEYDSKTMTESEGSRSQQPLAVYSKPATESTSGFREKIDHSFRNKNENTQVQMKQAIRQDYYPDEEQSQRETSLEQQQQRQQEQQQRMLSLTSIQIRSPAQLVSQFSFEKEDAIDEQSLTDIVSFRQLVHKLCITAQAYCIEFDEDYCLYYRSIGKTVYRMVMILQLLERKYLDKQVTDGTSTGSSMTSQMDSQIEFRQFEDKNQRFLPSSSSNSSVNVEKQMLTSSGNPEILHYLEIFSSIFWSVWTDDRETGWKSYVEEILLQVWSNALTILETTLTMKEMEKWIETAISSDYKGRLLLRFRQNELNRIAIKFQIMTFKDNPNINTYKSIIEKLELLHSRQQTSDDQIFSIKMELLQSLENSPRNEQFFSIRMQILFQEKKFDQLRNIVLQPLLLANELVLNICMQLAPIFPTDIIHKAQKEIFQSIVDLFPKLEERFETNGQMFQNWKDENFRIIDGLYNRIRSNSVDKQRFNEEDHDNDNNENNGHHRQELNELNETIKCYYDESLHSSLSSYPGFGEEHYIRQLRDTFVTDEMDMEYYQNYLTKYAILERSSDIFFEEPYESFKEMRNNEKNYAIVHNMILGWFQCAKIAICVYTKDVSVGQLIRLVSIT